MEHNRVLMYGIGIPEGEKMIPDHEKIKIYSTRSVPGGNELENEFLKKDREITVKDVKRAREILKKAMEEDPNIKGMIEAGIAMSLYSDMEYCAMLKDKFKWCLERAEKIVNLIFYGNEEGK